MDRNGNPLEGKELCWAQRLVPAGVEAFGNELDILNIPPLLIENRCGSDQLRHHPDSVNSATDFRYCG